MLQSMYKIYTNYAIFTYKITLYKYGNQFYRKLNREQSIIKLCNKNLKILYFN